MRISDWSSDVCSSDLADDVGYRQLELEGIAEVALQQAEQPQPVLLDHRLVEAVLLAQPLDARGIDVLALGAQLADQRSEERRVGKEWVSQCRSRWWPYH